MRCARSDPSDIVDEVPGICDLSTDIAELSKDTIEKGVLLSEGLVFEVGVSRGLLGLICHVCIGDLRKRNEEENDGEEEDKDGDPQVDPLNRRERVVINVLEDDLGCKYRSDDGADSLEGLGECETKFGVSWRSAGGYERVGCCFECGEATSNDEHAAAEPTKPLRSISTPHSKPEEGILTIS